MSKLEAPIVRSLVRVLVVPWAAAVLLTPQAARAQTAAPLTIPTVTMRPPLDPAANVAAWTGATTVTLGWDVQHQRPATEATTARVATDGAYLYVRFDVAQREALLNQQHTNNVGDGTDDEVWVDLWPSGASGFYYQFAATSNGTHFQYSSENSVYEPTWESFGFARAGGFTTTLKIPLRIMRGGGAWHAQFARIVRSTGEEQIWHYDRAQTVADDERFSGELDGIVTAVSRRPQPRVGLYGLGQLGAPTAGGSTSRLGADLSLPITPTASLYSTLHPDFSNVEIDQQTISPTAFQRVFTEVRPFFTQGASYYQAFACDACPGFSELYTPDIPTPRDGYAIEGQQGQMQFAAFDALSTGRSDAAQAIGYSTPDKRWKVSLQRVAADCVLPKAQVCQNDLPLVHDDIDTTGIQYNDGKHISAFFNYGSDSGNAVQLPNQAQRYDGGTFLYSNTSALAASIRKVGLYYNPADGIVQHPDIAGYGLYAAKIWLFDPHAALNSVGISGFLDRYHNMTGALDQTDNGLFFDVLTRNRIDLQLSSGSDYLLQNSACGGATCIFTPVSQYGASLTWHSGSANSPGNFPSHGSSSTPTTISFNTGRFGPGTLDSWFRSSTIRAGLRGSVTLEADDTRQYLDNGSSNIQWLERLSYAYATGADSSLAIGIRREIGTPPQLYTALPVTCTTLGFGCTGAWNLSLAYHYRFRHQELFVAYGDASQLSTYHAVIVKLIDYLGAEKGT